MAFAGTADRRFFFCADGDASWLVIGGGAKKLADEVRRQIC